MNCSIQTSHPPLASGMKANQVWFGTTQNPAGLGAGTSNLDFTFTKKYFCHVKFSVVISPLTQIFASCLFGQTGGGWMVENGWVGWAVGRCNWCFHFHHWAAPPSLATQTHKPTHCQGEKETYSSHWKIDQCCPVSSNYPKLKTQSCHYKFSRGVKSKILQIIWPYGHMGTSIFRF